MRFINSRNFELLRQLVITEFKIRYQGSVLGYLWSLLRPLALFTVLYIVFARFLRFGEGIPLFPAYLLLGIVLWSFFTEATGNGLRAIVDKGDMLRKVKVPTYALVLAATFSAFINLALNLCIVAVFLFVAGGSIGSQAIFFPLVLVEILIIALAASFLLSALFVRFRDIQFIWEVGLQVLFYSTPIIYPLSIVPEKFQKLIILSPIAQVIQDGRKLIVTNSATTTWDLHGPLVSLVPIGLVAVMAISAALYFKYQSKYFAENL